MTNPMSILSEIQPLIADAQASMRSDTRHNLAPYRRRGIYLKMGITADRSRGLNVIRGRLGVLSAERVLPVWQSISPIWTLSEEEIKSWNLSEEDLEHFRRQPDPNLLPERLLELTHDLLTGKISADAGLQKIHDENIWDTIGIMGLEFYQIRHDLPLVAYDACQAAHQALWEALNSEPFSDLSDLEHFTDDDLPDGHCDAAHHAVIAYSGGTRKEPVDLAKRREFWEWWLIEAIPRACSD